MAVAAEVQVIGRRAGPPGPGSVVQEPVTRPAFPAAYRGVEQRAVYLAYADLCEIGYEIAQGFLRSTPDWGYWCVSTSQSWLRERPFFLAQAQDGVFVDEIVRTADLLHLCEYHNYPQLERARPGKHRMVMHHHGVAYRDDPLKFEQAEIDAGYLRLVSTPDLLIHGSREGRKTLRWLPSPINVTEIERNYPAGVRGGPLVVGHGYTVAANKGSDFIVETVQRMRPAPTLNLMHGLQRRESLWHIRQCDIYVATMLYGPGMASLEAMAMGIPVVLGCTREEKAALEECYGEDLPFVWVTEQTLERKLKALISDQPLRRAVGEKGQRAIKRLHDVPAVVARLRALYEGLEPARSIVRA